MKGLYLPFVFLLFLILPNQLTGQNLSLKVLSDSQKDLVVIDSLGYKSKFKDYKSLDNEIISLRTRLTKIGYIDTKLITVDKKNDTLYETRFKLGKKVNRIRVYYDSTFDTDLLKIIDHVNGTDYFEIDINNLETDLTKLNVAIAEKGDPFASLQLENIIKLESNIISASLRVDTSQLRRIDNVIIKGYENFPKSYIKYFLKLKEGETFGLNEIKKKVELLEDLRFANKIKDPEVLFTRDSTTLYLYIEQVRTNNFDGFLGFGTNETTNKLEFDGYLDLKLVNNLNYGETLNLYYKSDEIDQQTFRVNVDLPFLFKTPIGLELGLNIFRKDSTFINVTQRANFNYQINALHKIGIGINAINSSNLLEEDTSVLNDYSSNYFTANYNFNRHTRYNLTDGIHFKEQQI